MFYTTTEELSERSNRHKIINNLLGTENFSPLVRKIDYLDENMKFVEEKIKLLAEKNFRVDLLYEKEWKASFELEGERINNKRLEILVNLLRENIEISSEHDLAVKIQNEIIENESLQAKSFRDFQNFVSHLKQNISEKIDFICPKPKDVERLMNSWLKTLLKQNEFPVVYASILSFGFVFIHPFEDGNGRLHRFIILYVLKNRGFLPISCSILRKRKKYYEFLERL